MTHPTTMHYSSATTKRRLQPLFGLAAAVAAVATLSLAVIAPAQYGAHDSVPLRAAIGADTQLVGDPAEVAILPGRIDVVGVRVRETAELAPADGRQRS